MEQCDFPRCRNLSDLVYIGHNICSLHWIELCRADDSKTEKRLLKKIKLTRDNKGIVCHIANKSK